LKLGGKRNEAKSGNAAPNIDRKGMQKKENFPHELHQPNDPKKHFFLLRWFSRLFSDV
jgi:hypothetical protein